MKHGLRVKAAVMAERILVKVGLQILGADVVIHAADTASSLCL